MPAITFIEARTGEPDELTLGVATQGDLSYNGLLQFLQDKAENILIGNEGGVVVGHIYDAAAKTFPGRPFYIYLRGERFYGIRVEGTFPPQPELAIASFLAELGELDPGTADSDQPSAGDSPDGVEGPPEVQGDGERAPEVRDGSAGPDSLGEAIPDSGSSEGPPPSSDQERS
jgi:hypothetical protein